MIALMVGLVVYILFVLLIAREGQIRKIGYGKAFVIALFLTPVVGWRRVEQSEVVRFPKNMQHQCKCCGTRFSIDAPWCPDCAVRGHRILVTYQVSLPRIIRSPGKVEEPVTLWERIIVVLGYRKSA